MLTASILAVGDEIVGGLTTDTNSGFLSQLLRSAGVRVVGFFAVDDDRLAIERALRRAFDDSDLVVTTGGLGPTADDLTTESVAGLAGAPLELDAPSLAAIEERFARLGVEMPPNNRKQAMLPRGGRIIPNPTGTAPGFALRLSHQNPTPVVVTLPGVPSEMRRMAEESLLPLVAELGGGGVFGSRVFSTVGLTESKLDQLLAGSVEPGEARLSFRAAFPRLQARVTALAPTEKELTAILDELTDRISCRLGDHLYAVGDVGLEEVVGNLLRERKLSLALAESCTGGLIGHRITEVPGSSEYLLGDVVAYSNDLKKSFLGVAQDTIEGEGAVSEATVIEMARGARAATGASIGLATSGIAGPGGGTEAKPVGTVCVGLAWPDGVWARRFQLGQRSRSWIKEMTAQLALDALRRHLQGKLVNPDPSRGG